ncbi:hypothetical protein [Halomarina pelagica]|uniref:hypothetical protein n=1 Tax=Halomarina pelagica TaxID=2961599 RepID=UPI0020C27D5D|nr:hypothetical protein [Halomarina sp. BND7]
MSAALRSPVESRRIALAVAALAAVAMPLFLAAYEATNGTASALLWAFLALAALGSAAIGYATRTVTGAILPLSPAVAYVVGPGRTAFFPAAAFVPLGVLLPLAFGFVAASAGVSLRRTLAAR